MRGRDISMMAGAGVAMAAAVAGLEVASPMSNVVDEPLPQPSRRRRSRGGNRYQALRGYRGRIYSPNGKREVARRLRQIAKGQLKTTEVSVTSRSVVAEGTGLEKVAA